MPHRQRTCCDIGCYRRHHRQRRRCAVELALLVLTTAVTSAGHCRCGRRLCRRSWFRPAPAPAGVLHFTLLSVSTLGDAHALDDATPLRSVTLTLVLDSPKCEPYSVTSVDPDVAPVAGATADTTGCA